MPYFILTAGTALSAIIYYLTEIKFFMCLGYILATILGIVIMANTIKIEKNEDRREAEMLMNWQTAAQQRCADEKRRKRIAKQKANKAKRGY